MENGTPCGRKREPIPSGGTVDLILPFSWKDMDLVLNDWNEIMRNEHDIAVQISQRLFYEHPSYKSLFPGLSRLSDEQLFENCDFLKHSCAVTRSLNAILKFLNGIYEDDADWASFIGETHRKRKINLIMFEHLKEAVLDVCWGHLKSDKKSKAAWMEVMNFIFQNYFTKSYEK